MEVIEGHKKVLVWDRVSHGTIGTQGGDTNPEAGNKEEFESALGPGWRVWGRKDWHDSDSHLDGEDHCHNSYGKTQEEGQNGQAHIVFGGLARKISNVWE